MPSYPSDAVNVVADRLCDLSYNLPYDEAEDIARDLVIDVTIMVDKLRAAEALAVVQGDKHEAPASCCDGYGQVHHGEGALSWVTLCRDAECVARREAAWAAECGETPASGEEQA
jgi:hypothetical protein